jgi:hypothetical protein
MHREPLNDVHNAECNALTATPSPGVTNKERPRLMAMVLLTCDTHVSRIFCNVRHDQVGSSVEMSDNPMSWKYHFVRSSEWQWRFPPLLLCIGECPESVLLHPRTFVPRCNAPLPRISVHKNCVVDITYILVYQLNVCKVLELFK